MSVVAVALLFIGGMVGGFYGSVVGSAGLVSVSLLTVLGLPPAMAVATSRPAGVVLELVSAVAYWKRGVLTRTEIYAALRLGIASAIGAVAGALLVSYIPNSILNILFSVVMLGFGFTALDPRWTQRFARPAGNWFVENIGMLFLGVYGGFFAFVYGTLLTLFLVWRGRSFLQSAAQGRVIGICMSVSAAAVFAWQQLINVPYTIPLAIGFAIGAWFGVGAGIRYGENYVKYILRLVVVLAVCKLLLDTWLAQ